MSEFSWGGAFTSTSSTVQTELCCVGLDVFCAGPVKKDAMLLWTLVVQYLAGYAHFRVCNIVMYTMYLCAWGRSRIPRLPTVWVR